MPIVYEEYRRRPGVDRNDLGAAALNLCKAWRASNDLVRQSKFYWINFNDLAFITEGEPGFANPTAIATPDMASALAGMYDVADQSLSRTLAEARMGQDTWEAAGRPSGS